MKNFYIIASILLATFFFPISVQAGIYAKYGYDEGQNGILLLTEKCSANAEFQIAVARKNGIILEGCYVMNNRGNPVVKWSNGKIEELDGRIFNIKNASSEDVNKSMQQEEKISQNENQKDRCRVVYQAWVFNNLLENSCNFNKKVSTNLMAEAKKYCNSLSNDFRVLLGKEVIIEIKKDLDSIGTKEFCRRNKPSYEELEKSMKN